MIMFLKIFIVILGFMGGRLEGYMENIECEYRVYRGYKLDGVLL